MKVYYCFILISLCLCLCSCQSATRSVVNPVIPSDTPTPSPVSASNTPTSSITESPTSSISESPSPSQSQSNSISLSSSSSVSPSVTPSRSEIPRVSASLAPEISITGTPSPTIRVTVYDGPNSSAVEFELFACGGSCSNAQINAIIFSISQFLNISEDSVEIFQRNGVLFITVCTSNPDELLNAISESDEDLSSNLLETSTIVSEPVYLDSCPIQRESSSNANIILVPLISLFTGILIL